MSSDPLVCCVLLTRDRPEMARRAVDSFRAQTYENKRLLVYDNSLRSPENHKFMVWLRDVNDASQSEMWYARCSGKETIGKSRNMAGNMAVKCIEADIIAHWDDDDWSHPNRLAEQVALLQASGAEAVGYSDMLFWDERATLLPNPAPTGEAWRYSGYLAKDVLGTSLMYWRKTWERVPFDDIMTGEDDRFWRKVLGFAETSMAPPCRAPLYREPRMIASIHGGNTSSRINPNHPQWVRRLDLDAYCRERMAL